MALVIFMNDAHVFILDIVNIWESTSHFIRDHLLQLKVLFYCTTSVK